MMWRCLKLVRYSTLVLDTIIKVFRTNKLLEPRMCVLGGLDGEFYTPQKYMAILRLCEQLCES